jgi:hypothetical protein
MIHTIMHIQSHPLKAVLPPAHPWGRSIPVSNHAYSQAAPFQPLVSRTVSCFVRVIFPSLHNQQSAPKRHSPIILSFAHPPAPPLPALPRVTRSPTLSPLRSARRKRSFD